MFRIIANAIAVTLTLLLSTGLDAQGGPLPLDPLTSQERKLAATIARANPRSVNSSGKGEAGKSTRTLLP